MSSLSHLLLAACAVVFTTPCCSSGVQSAAGCMVPKALAMPAKAENVTVGELQALLDCRKLAQAASKEQGDAAVP